MSVTIHVDISHEQKAQLVKRAADAQKSLSDYIRYCLFGDSAVSIFTPEEVVRRIQATAPAKPFTIPELYTPEEWKDAQARRGVAGLLGRLFFRYVTDHPEVGIQYLPEIKKEKERRSVYQYTKIRR